MDVKGPEEFFLKLSLNDTLIPDSWQRVCDFYFGNKGTPDSQDLIKVREICEEHFRVLAGPGGEGAFNVRVKLVTWWQNEVLYLPEFNVPTPHPLEYYHAYIFMVYNIY
jgi:hypothetical protein